MRKVSIIGIGSTKFGKYKDTPITTLALEAVENALEDANVDSKSVRVVTVGNFAGGSLAAQRTLAPLIAYELGAENAQAMTYEAACASGSVAFREAYLKVASGVCDYALVVGVEKMSSNPTEYVTETLATALNEVEKKAGLTFVGFFALVANLHMHKYGTTREQLAMVSVKNRKNGAKNPMAQFQKEVKLDEVLQSRMISYPLRLFDCSPISDGAAAVVLCPSEIARKHTDTVVEVIGSGHEIGKSASYEYSDLTTLIATRKAADATFNMAKISRKDVDVIELHDCFTIAEIVDSEDLGFFKKGEGGKAVEEGVTEVGGDLPINPSGGLLSKRHPIGATGVGQIYEIVKQLREEHPNQVDGAEIGLTHNLGATGSVATVHLLKRRD